MNGWDRNERIAESVKVLREVQAPSGFLDGVLRKVGLLDGYARVESAIGPVYVARGAHGITAVLKARGPAEFECLYAERFGRRAEQRPALAPELRRALDEGKRAEVDLNACSAFQRAVLEATRRIPAGAVRPYAWIAKEVGRPRAARAVGTALAGNPVPLIVPCHRVVRSDGEMGQYALGAQRKVRLLREEGVDIPDARRRVAARGFWSNEGDDTFCYPYCFSAAQARNGHFSEFRTAQEALSRGLRPCSVCRPSLAA